MPIGLNITAFFIGIASAYFLIMAWQIARYWSGRKRRLNRVLAITFIFLTLQNMKDLVYTFPSLYTQPTLNAIALSDGWTAIFFAIFLFELAVPGWVTVRRTVVIALPFAAFSVIYATTLCEWVMRAYYVFLCMFAIVVVIVGYWRALRYIRFIKDNYSDIDCIDISWVKYFYLATAVSQLIWLFTSLIGEAVTDWLYYVSEIALWQIVVYHCRKLRQISEKEEQLMIHPPTVPSVRDYQFAGEMERLVEAEQLYLQPELQLEQLARRLSTNRTYLSNYFANVLHTTFYDYINSLRIKHSVPLMEQHADYTLEYIAQQSGFRSISTFRRAFRKFMGENPIEYRKKLS